ncbi:hypothetical protein [Pedobacter frigidisoli]|nr:hypothetical protein [Pedobacter frigidisoli]
METQGQENYYQAYLLTSFKRQLVYQWKREKKIETIANFPEDFELDESEMLEAEIITAQFSKLQSASNY